MRFSLILALLTTCFVGVHATEDAPLHRLLRLLGEVRIGDDYAAVKKLAPEIGPLRKDAGDNNTEAIMSARLGEVVLAGEFNFAKARLVSHGFRAEKLTHAQAHDLFLRCVGILDELYGQSERRIALPTEHDGPRDSIGISFAWRTDRARLGLDLSYRSAFASVQWGAQE